MNDWVWQALLGSYCVLCRERVKGAAGPRQLCDWCLASLPWRPVPEEAPALSDITSTFAPLAFEGAARQWVLDAKRESGLIAARMLGVLLGESLQEAYPFPSQRPHLLIPMPLSRRRLRARGHNQAALIASQVARILEVRLVRHQARRTRHTPILAGLDARQRQAQVAGSFEASTLPENVRLAIIDDVLTTGATAAALAAALRDAGAAEVHLWVATRAPHPG